MLQHLRPLLSAPAFHIPALIQILAAHTPGEGVEDGPSAWVVATYLRDAGGIPVPELAPANSCQLGSEKVDRKKKKEDRRLLLSLSLSLLL